MISFSNFISESFLKISGSEGQRHASTYVTPFMNSDKKIELGRDHESIKSGSKLKVISQKVINGKHYTDVEHPETGKTVTVPNSKLIKAQELKKRRGDTLNIENSQISSIQSQIQEQIKNNGGKPIKMRMPDGNIHEIAGIKASSELTGGKNVNAKADAYLHDKDGNPLHFMSLKGDKYFQWGGYKDLENHPVMKKVISKFQELKNRLSPREKYLPQKSIYHYKLDKNNPEERSMIAKAMYGRNHGGEYGIHNVHAIYGGNTITLKPSDASGVFQLHADTIHTNSNDEKADITDTKIMLHRSSGHDQAGTGGRITFQHASNVKSSTPINDGIDQAIRKRTTRTDEPHVAEHGGKTWLADSEKPNA